MRELRPEETTKDASRLKQRIVGLLNRTRSPDRVDVFPASRAWPHDDFDIRSGVGILQQELRDASSISPEASWMGTEAFPSSSPRVDGL